jgi:3-oxoacyl-[acyl-carrier protein] reductase
VLVSARERLTLSLASQYGKNNISFACVNPGPARTERWTGLVQPSRDMNLSCEEADTLAPASIPLGRIAESDEVGLLRQRHMIEIDGGQEKPLKDRLRDR